MAGQFASVKINDGQLVVVDQRGDDEPLTLRVRPWRLIGGAPVRCSRVRQRDVGRCRLTVSMRAFPFGFFAALPVSVPLMKARRLRGSKTTPCKPGFRMEGAAQNFVLRPIELEYLCMRVPPARGQSADRGDDAPKATP